jgi:hypothetical protein
MVESDVGRSRFCAPGPAWRRSSFCASGECVEVSAQDGMIILRNSKNPAAVVRYSGREWRSFLLGIKAGEFDDLECHPTE